MINYELGIIPHWIVILFLIFNSGLAPGDPKNLNSRRPLVVIDPGHGGRDHGAKGKISIEKEINLQVAKRIQSELYSGLPSVEVILTRDTDEFVSLKERGRIANALNADIFISLHCNSNHNGKIRGVETYVMGLDKAENNALITARENSEIAESGNELLMNPNSAEDLIFINQLLSSNQQHSIEFADLCYQHILAIHPGKGRPTRQAGFVVLWSTTMPSVLIELGYLNNPQDEEFLNQEEGQTKIARALSEAIKIFLERRNAEASSTSIPPNRFRE